jgi:hypothetical protein
MLAEAGEIAAKHQEIEGRLRRIGIADAMNAETGVNVVGETRRPLVGPRR